MLTKILIRIIMVLLLINALMILTVFAIPTPDESIATYTITDTYSEIECELAIEPTSVSICESVHGHESTESMMITVNDTTLDVEIETMQSIDDNPAVNSEFVQLPEIKSAADQSAEKANDDSLKDDCTMPAVCYDLSYEDRDMLLRIAMAEVGCEDCVECCALVMKTVLNRVESPLFPSTIYRVIHAENQFSPVASGTFATVRPNDKCYEALDLVISGWDESQGALYFEACAGSSWHSRNLEFLLQHCSTRFYK